MTAHGPFPDVALLRGLARDLPTPFFLLSAAELRRRHALLRRSLSSHVEQAVLRYSAKTNHEESILSLLAELGAEVMASHLDEARLALVAGFPARSVSFQRPVLTPAELDGLLAAGIRRVHLHRPDDLPLLERAARRHDTEILVSLRLRDPGRASPLGLLSRRLGLRPAEAAAVAARAGATPRLRPAGLNFYVGTQRESPSRHLAALASAFRVAGALRRAGISVTEINLGGGLPSASIRRLSPSALPGRLRDRLRYRTEADIEAWCRKISAAFAGRARHLGPAPALVAETGRALVGDAGVLVTRVRAVRGRWAFLDASRGHMRESPLLLSRRIVPLQEGDGGGERRYHLSGPTLNTVDVLDLGRRLPPLRAGDLLALCGAGAYSISRSDRYAGPPPAVFLLDPDGGLRRFRRAETLEDLRGPMEPARTPAARRSTG